MIKVQIISAANLPVPTKKERKTKIVCFSSSSCSYFYDSFKNNENTRNPKWSSSFDVDLFRCSYIHFKIYSSQLLSSDIFLGEVNIDFSKFLNESPGNQILQMPYGNIRCEFPITSCTSPNATLSLSFLFIPKSYRLIKFNDVKKPLIHVWATFTPSLQGIGDNIEIELLQAYADKENKTGYFYSLDNSNSWESVGYSSSSSTFLGPTGFTPIRTFSISRIDGLFNFFIVNVSNYSGVITLNFVAEQKGKKEFFDEKPFFSLKKDKKNSIGTFKTVDIKVESNKKYCVPFYLFIEKKLIKDNFEFMQIQSSAFETQMVSKSDYIDQICSEIPFQTSIIQMARNKIESFKDINIMKTFVLPLSEKVSLHKVFSQLNIQYKPKIKIYINGSTTITTGNITVVHYWRPLFQIFDKKTGQLCSEIQDQLIKKPFFTFREKFEKSSSRFKWHTSVVLDLDSIGIDKVVIFNIACMSYLCDADPDGIFHITSLADDGKEVLLFRNPIYEDSQKSKCGTFMRFEFIEDSWCVVPMRYCFNKKKKMISANDALFKNNWMLPQSFNEKQDEESSSHSADDLLIYQAELND